MTCRKTGGLSYVLVLLMAFHSKGESVLSIAKLAIKPFLSVCPSPLLGVRALD